jgi:hypothetical protein
MCAKRLFAMTASQRRFAVAGALLIATQLPGAQQPAYPAKIIRLIVFRVQLTNSTASYRNRGQLSSSTHTNNSLDNISRNAGYFEIISLDRWKFSAARSCVSKPAHNASNFA